MGGSGLTCTFILAFRLVLTRVYAHWRSVASLRKSLFVIDRSYLVNAFHGSRAPAVFSCTVSFLKTVRVQSLEEFVSRAVRGLLKAFAGVLRWPCSFTSKRQRSPSIPERLN
jgi:hypothetical protein